tara:strand:+ start:272 stop:610 length:339 start_codon:yes stop_codon:yes gene_type:complete
MANTFKSITSGSIGTTLVGVYTCPGSTTSIVLGASMANTHSSPIGSSIKLKKDGSAAGQDDVFVVKTAPVPVGSSVEVMAGNKVVLQAADVLQFQSDTATSLDVVVSVLEIT